MLIKHHTNEVKSWQVKQLKDAVQGKSSLVRVVGYYDFREPYG